MLLLRSLLVFLLDNPVLLAPIVQAEAIKKILGIDSEKKKEERKLKEREEQVQSLKFYESCISRRATINSFNPFLFSPQEKQERFEEYKRNCIQCVMGPEGTVITFPDKMGLPSIFNSKPSRLHTLLIPVLSAILCVLF